MQEPLKGPQTEHLQINTHGLDTESNVLVCLIYVRHDTLSHMISMDVRISKGMKHIFQVKTLRLQEVEQLPEPLWLVSRKAKMHTRRLLVQLAMGYRAVPMFRT